MVLSEDAERGADVNPLWYGEFPEKLIPIVRAKCKFLVGDAQGADVGIYDLSCVGCVVW